MPIDSKVCDKDGVRLDSFVTEAFDSTYSRSFYKRLIDDGKITVNGIIITKAGTKLSAGDVVEADIPTKTSDLQNDSGFITSSDLTNLATKTELGSAVDVTVQ